MTKLTITFGVGLLAVWGLTACSSRQAYTAGQAWRQNQCNALTNMEDRRRCMKEAGQPYDDYKQDVDGVRK